MSHPLTNCDALPASSGSASSPRNGGAPRSLPLSRRLRLLSAGAALALAGYAIAGVALARDYHSNPWLLSWIPAACCVTNDCCWEVSERELRPMPNDQWQVVSTGQVRQRTDWSPDGKFYRCACDYDSASQNWIKHQGANTRCIFVPMRTAARWIGLAN
jgi:hypothetical protein